jgi:hypothetical protein
LSGAFARTYKRKVVEHKANETALVAAENRNLLGQTMFCEDDDPNNHDEEEGSSRSELELDVLNEGHHGKRDDQCCRDLLQLGYIKYINKISQRTT